MNAIRRRVYREMRPPTWHGTLIGWGPLGIVVGTQHRAEGWCVHENNEDRGRYTSEQRTLG